MQGFGPTLVIFTVASALAAVAVPLDRHGPVGVKQGGQSKQGYAVSEADITQFAVYAQYAGAAYCNSQAPVGSVVSCDSHVCDWLTAANATILATVGTANLSSPTNMEGFVAADPVRRALVVAMRGSATLRNFATDLKADLVPCGDYMALPLPLPLLLAREDDASGSLLDSNTGPCMVHRGFGEAWAAVRDETLAAVQAAQLQFADWTVIVTGHSLGGAVASLAAAELRARGIACSLYTYGSPRVGNAVLAAFLTTQRLGQANNTGAQASSSPDPVLNYRMTYLDDPVPQLPPLSFGYRHTSPEIWLDAGQALVLGGDGGAAVGSAASMPLFPGEILYSPSDFTVCVGYDNTDCNAGTGLVPIDIAAHLTYFELITGCDRTVAI